MKQILAALLFMASLAVSGQTVTFYNDPIGSTITWQIINTQTNVTVATFTNSIAGQIQAIEYNLPAGNYVMNVQDAACDGLQGGLISVFNENSEFIGLGQGFFGCALQFTFQIEAECQADFDNNGFIGVADLIIFIGQYGQICN